MSLYDLTVTFPTYNRIEDVRKTLDLLKINLLCNYEVIIADNSETENHLSLGKNEHYVFMGYNGGAAARNAGVKLAKAPYILMLDDDSHPLRGSVESALEKLNQSEDSVGGMIGEIVESNNVKRSSLLPTVFHGCGVMFKTDVMRKLHGGYPENFRFYGEEYWLTLLLYRSGYHLDYDENFQIYHRVSQVGRSCGKIFYQLIRNNEAVWHHFCPDMYLDEVLYDTKTRYELLSIKENVHEFYLKGLQDKLIINDQTNRLKQSQFLKFSLLDNFEKLYKKFGQFSRVILCGCGKFPTLWAHYLTDQGVSDILFTDFNVGLIGKEFKNFKVYGPDKLPEFIANGYKLIIGHSSIADNNKWINFVRENGIDSKHIFPIEL